ncbi:MAG: acylneuraminate cytidylyltransferase family protein [Syntrophomonadaceae bacterium]|nr:acylneuraminate cytidylyltransferase family protein [Syntrophomonadaceae bacterium]
MINKQKVLGIIPARGGSKTLPRKNIKILAGKPLIAWTIEEARKSKYIDRLIISSDDDEIIEAAKKWGGVVPFVRPAALAADETPGIEPIIHALNTLEEKFDYVVLLQPTSPLRTVSDIDECIHCCIQQAAPVCVSVSAAAESPYWMYTLSKQQRLYPLLPGVKLIDRRQDFPVVYLLNGAVYVARTDYLLKEKSFISEETVAYIMPAERSWDIDDEMDFLICEFTKAAAQKKLY